jgi:hypothetical protein
MGRQKRGDQTVSKSKAVECINNILMAWGWGTGFGHSFRIGGASHYLAEKVDPEIIRIAGRWKSLAYEVYIRAFENVVSRHMGDHSNPRQSLTSWVGRCVKFCRRGRRWVSG